MDVTVPVYIDPATAERPVSPGTREVLRALARLEARRNLRAPWLWLGMVLTAVTAHANLDVDFSGGGYQGVSAAFAALAAGTFVLAVLAGSRDRTATNDTPLAPEAVLDADHRALARLLGLIPPLAMGALFTLGVFVVARVEGGFWVGDVPGRTDSAQHGLFEALQPLALLVLATTTGVALGRATAQRTLVCLLGALVTVVFGFVYWAWQGEPLAYVTLVQTQPFEVPMSWPGGRVDLGLVPADWLLSAPDAYESRWAHLVFDQRIAAAHDAYLLGLATVATGFAVRGRALRPLVAGGALLAVAAVAAQIAL